MVGWWAHPPAAMGSGKVWPELQQGAHAKGSPVGEVRVSQWSLLARRWGPLQSATTSTWIWEITHSKTCSSENGVRGAIELWLKSPYLHGKYCSEITQWFRVGALSPTSAQVVWHISSCEYKKSPWSYQCKVYIIAAETQLTEVIDGSQMKIHGLMNF